jgi:hypothetical protein
VVTEHVLVVFRYMVATMFVGWNQLVVQRETFQMRTGDNSETAVLHSGVNQIVVEK